MVEEIKEYVEITKRGFPALWEEGGGMTNTGHSRIIANSEGGKKKPIYIRTGGHLALGEHALFIVEEGDIVIDVRRHHEDFDICVKQIKKIKNEQDKLVAEMAVLTQFNNGEWSDPEIVKKYKEAIEVAKEKSKIYHCRSPLYYILQD